MKQNLKSSIRFQDEEILAGFKFKMQYLGCGEELKFGGTDHEIANVIHDIHSLYAERNTKLSKARTVVVFVDAQKIDIFNETEDEILLTFPLVYVKDVTACLNQAPYSKTCVLLAKDYNDPLYKAFVFYCKTTAQAAEFYHFTRGAFQLGFKRMENDSLNSGSTADEETLESSSNSAPKGSSTKANGQLQEAKNDEIAPLDDDPADCDSLQDFGKNSPESEKLLNSGTEFLQLKNKDRKQSKKSSQQPVTVRISNKNSSFARHEKQAIKFNLKLGDENNNVNPSKIGVFKDAVGESRFLIPHWLRNSCRKFRKMSAQRPSCETAQAV